MAHDAIDGEIVLWPANSAVIWTQESFGPKMKGRHRVMETQNSTKLTKSSSSGKALAAKIHLVFRKACKENIRFHFYLGLSLYLAAANVHFPTLSMFTLETMPLGSQCKLAYSH